MLYFDSVTTNPAKRILGHVLVNKVIREVLPGSMDRIQFRSVHGVGPVVYLGLYEAEENCEEDGGDGQVYLLCPCGNWGDAVGPESSGVRKVDCYCDDCRAEFLRSEYMLEDEEN